MWILYLVLHSDAEVLKYSEGKHACNSFNEAMHENNGNLNIFHYKTKIKKTNWMFRKTAWEMNFGNGLSECE